MNRFSLSITFLTGAILLLGGCNQQSSLSPLVVPDKWKKVELSSFSFFGPSDMKIEDAQGIDSEVWRYGSDNIRLDINLGMYSTDLQVYSHQPNYHEELAEIDGKEAKICTFYLDDSFATTADRDHRFISAAHFHDLGDGSTKLTFWASCREQAGQETAKIIFRSIKFNRSFK